MKTSCRHLASAALLAAAGLPLHAASGVAASDAATPRITSLSQMARARLAVAFTAARDFRPRSDRSLYELGREDAEIAMRAADALVSTEAERVLANNIHSYFAARNACRLANTVSEYGTCEARVHEQLGEKIMLTLESADGR